jgi:hypothetical protein
LSETENKDSYTISFQGTFNEAMTHSTDFISLINTFNKGKDDMKRNDNNEGSINEGGINNEGALMTPRNYDHKGKPQNGAPSQTSQRLVEEEEREEGTVSGAVIKYYYGTSSWLSFAVIIFFFLTSFACVAGADFWFVYASP